MSFRLRAATAADQGSIRDLIHTVGINPMSLSWPRFVVAVDDAGEMIGCGQVKPHSDGTRELASLAVVAPWRGRGVARAMVERLMAEAGPPLWLTCRARLVPLYERFGFKLVLDPASMSPYFRRLHSLANLFLRLVRPGEGLAIMLWPDSCTAGKGFGHR